MRVIAAVVLSMFVAHGAVADERQPWQWTDEERVAVRYNPQSMRERAEAHHKMQLQRNPKARPLSTKVNVIDGTRNPELLLPWELFQDLAVRTSFAGTEEARAANRRRYARLAPWLAGDPEFWSRFEKVVQPFLDALARSRERGRLARESGIPPERTNAVCQSRHAALEAARSEFGRDRFDEFLYTAVAPGPVTFTDDADTDDADAPATSRLLWIAGGCR